MSDAELVADVRAALKVLADKMTEANKSGITVDVNLMVTHPTLGAGRFVDCSKIYRKREHVENF